MIKAIFFDFDGVLTRDKSGYLTTCRNLHKYTGIPLEKLSSACRTSGDYYNGYVSTEKFWEGVCRKLGRKLDIELLRRAYREVPVDPRMMNLARDLRRKYKVGIITDNPKERFDSLMIILKLDARFDSIMASSLLHSSKNEEGIFRYALDSIGLSPGECVFIDNSEKNLEIPGKMGFRTIHFDDEKRDMEGLKSNLRKSGVEPD